MKKALPPQTILHPHPVLIIGTYGQQGKPNLATASWGGICCSEPPCVAVSFRKATLTYHNIIESKAFTVGIPCSDQAALADYLGMVSGKDENKFERCHLIAQKSAKVNAPFADDFPYTLECKLIHTFEFGLHTQFVGQIVGILADEKILGEGGAPDIEKVKPIIYGSFGSSNYYALGEKLGRAFSLGKKIF
ncbi:MAG: flavin reductase family protein [Pseudomonadota bacterium]